MGPYVRPYIRPKRKISETALRIFQIFCMKLKGHKVRKVTESDFSKKIRFPQNLGKMVPNAGGSTFGQYLTGGVGGCATPEINKILKVLLD